MLNFFDTPGDVITSTSIWILGGFLIMLLGQKIGTSTIRCTAIYVYHSFFCLIFTSFTRRGGVDSATYYASARDGDVVFGIGTPAISMLGYLPVQLFDLSYLGTNIVFAALSCAGLILIDRVIRTLAESRGPFVQFCAIVFIFMPSLHFWTTSISKDSLMMLATGMLLWFAKNPSRHLMLLLSALTIMLLVRPHMALMFLIALGVGNILTGRMSLIAKIGFTFLSVLLVAFLLPALMDLFNIGSDLNDIAQYIESRQEIIEGGSSIILSEMVWPARLFAFLFRPLIFEGGNAIALVAGIENTILVTFMLLILLKARKGFRHDPDLPGKMVLLSYAVISWWLLGNVTYNLGLAARQKWMVLPFVVVVLIAMSRSYAHERTALRARLRLHKRTVE